MIAYSSSRSTLSSDPLYNFLCFCFFFLAGGGGWWGGAPGVGGKAVGWGWGWGANFPGCSKRLARKSMRIPFSRQVKPIDLTSPPSSEVLDGMLEHRNLLILSKGHKAGLGHRV